MLCSYTQQLILVQKKPDAKALNHFANCINCRYEAARLQSMLRTLRALRHESLDVPEDLITRVLEAVYADRGSRRIIAHILNKRLATYLGALAGIGAGIIISVLAAYSKKRRQLIYISSRGRVI